MQKKDINIGVSLLKIILSFEVVLIHFWGVEGYPDAVLLPFFGLRSYSVPTFMLVSFFLMERSLKRDGSNLRKRLCRLLIPQVGWTIIYLPYNVMQKDTLNFREIVVDFLWQLFTGSKYNPPMWYMIDVIILTLVIWSLFRFFDQKTALKICFVLMFFALILQYSGLNMLMFSNLRAELKYTLGRLSEMIPLAVTGIFLSSYSVIEKIKERFYRPAVIVSAMVVLGVVALASIILPERQDFGYFGIIKMVASVLLMMIFVLLPFEKLNNNLKRIIHSFSGLTLGIYCMHIMIGSTVKQFFDTQGIPQDTFIMCVTIFIVCCIVSYLISLVPLKTVRGLVK